jgi:5S rRNA maturation endonuclease (ribonuclease M5)
VIRDVLRELILPRLDHVKKSGGGFMARCPVHDDGKASLAISPGKDQPAVLHCHAGCEPDDVLARLGLTWAELSHPRSPSDDEQWTPAGPAVAMYDYRNEHGELLFQVCRTANKSFLQRTPDHSVKTGWRWKLGDTRRVLYRLPEVIAAVNDGREVYIVEGEKDVHSLESLGLVATCNPGGAGKWRPEYTEVLREAVTTIIADRDEPGQAHARQVRDALTGVAAAVYIMEPAEGCKDVTDHINAGHDLTQLLTTYSSEQPVKVELAPDLWEFIAVDDEHYDWLVPDLIERGDRLILTGFEGLGKSMLTRQLAVTIAAGIHPFEWKHPIGSKRVLYIDCENSERQSRRKFRPLAAASIANHHRVPDGGLRIILRPEGIDLTRDQDASWLLERVTAHRPDVLFIGPFYRLHNANVNEELPARKTVAVLDRARTAVDCALVIEAHSGHGEAGKNRSVRPAGSSLLLRWPEFGYGIRPATDARPCRHVEFAPWRGDREARNWPTHLAWADSTSNWPWQVAPSPEELK